jgi:uncharacterized protein YkwD
VARRLRRLVLALALTLLTFGVVGAAAAPTARSTVAADDGLERSVLVELNAVRRAHGLVPLRASAPLARAADAHSRAMGVHGFFEHDSRDGSPFWERVERYYGRTSRWSVGENLVWGSTGSIDARRAVELWMASPGHRKNILTARWREIGLSAVRVSAAPGVFGGRDVVIVTTDFGVR